MAQITITHYLFLSALMFGLGLIGVMTRRNVLVVLMSIEVLMNAVNLAFVALSRFYHTVDGHIVAIFVMSIAAVEAAIGLGIVISIFRNRQTIDTDKLTSLHG